MSNPKSKSQKHRNQEIAEAPTHSNDEDILIEGDVVAINTPLSKSTSTEAPARATETHTVTGVDPGSTESKVSLSLEVEAVAEPLEERIQLVAISMLKPNPLNIELYGDEPVDEELKSSLQQHGFQEPMICTKDYDLVAGHRRYKAASAIGLTHVPVIIREFKTSAEITAALLESNRQRRKSNEVLGREAIKLKEVATELAKLRQKSGIQTDQTVPTAKGASRDQVGEKLGMSGVTADRLVITTQAIETLVKEGRNDEADQLRGELNKSINAGYNEGIRLEVISKPEPKKKGKTTPHTTSKKERATTQPTARAKTPLPKKEESSAYTTTGDLPQIENHALAMRHLDLLIEYVEDLGGDNIKTGHREEWQESMQSLTDALRKMGIIED